MESGHPGFIPTWKGRPTTRKYQCASVYADHASEYINLTLHESTGAQEALQGKARLERFSAEHGVKINHFRSDNGVCVTKAYKNAVQASNQTIDFCGVNAHHQNGIAERTIRTFHDQARTMLIHAMIHCPEEITEELWTLSTLR